MRSERGNGGDLDLRWPAKESRQSKNKQELDPSGWNKEKLDKIESKIMESENKDKNNGEKAGMSRKEFLLTVAGLAVVAGGVGKFIKWFEKNEQDIEKAGEKIENKYKARDDSIKEKKKIDAEIRENEEFKVQKAQEEGNKANEKLIDFEKNTESD